MRKNALSLSLLGRDNSELCRAAEEIKAGRGEFEANNNNVPRAGAPSSGGECSRLYARAFALVGGRDRYNHRIAGVRARQADLRRKHV